MGCDIHTACEIKGDDGIWRIVKDKVFDSPYDFEIVDEGGKWRTVHREPGDPPFKTDAPYEGRNYLLFSALADVRNGYGFAGVPTYTPVPVIAEPRGVPLDASREWKKYSNDWSADGHSHSFLTLKEIDEWSGWEHVVDGEGTIRELVSSHFWHAVEQMRAMAPEGNTGRIRMVFLFDN